MRFIKNVYCNTKEVFNICAVYSDATITVAIDKITFA